MRTEVVIPLFPLGVVLFPDMPLPLHIFEERYKTMIRECLDEGKAFGVVYFSGDPDFMRLSFHIAGNDGFTQGEKQKFLEMTSTHDRLEKSVESLGKMVKRVEITKEIQRIIGGNGKVPSSLTEKVQKRD